MKRRINGKRTIKNANSRNEHDKQGRTFQNTVKAHSGLETDIRAIRRNKDQD